MERALLLMMNTSFFVVAFDFTVQNHKVVILCMRCLNMCLEIFYACWFFAGENIMVQSTTVRVTRKYRRFIQISKGESLKMRLSTLFLKKNEYPLIIIRFLRNRLSSFERTAFKKRALKMIFQDKSFQELSFKKRAFKKRLTRTGPF